MPIVFIHGVNNRREDPEYEEGIKRKEKFLKTIFAPKLELDNSTLECFFPYWGEDGVKFCWNNASLPSPSASAQSLMMKSSGPTGEKIGSNELDPRTVEVLIQHEFDGQISLANISKTINFEKANDLFWDIAAANTSDSANLDAIAKGYMASLKYLEQNPSPDWATGDPSLTNEQFADRLLSEIEKLSPQHLKSFTDKVFGRIRKFSGTLKERLERLAAAPADAATALVVEHMRRKAHLSASRFLGDVFYYLTRKGTQGTPGPIVEAVIKALDEAKASASGAEKLIVIGHSLGAVILYDIATHFRPDIKIDVFISVGSQVALFEEMTLLSASSPCDQNKAPTKRVSKPSSISTWLNVYDTNDVFSFSANAVFEGVEDLEYNNGYGLLQSHGGYFLRPSFYNLLAARITKSKPAIASA